MAPLYRAYTSKLNSQKIQICDCTSGKDGTVSAAKYTKRDIFWRSKRFSTHFKTFFHLHLYFIGQEKLTAAGLQMP